jgi:uncharacterized iron-regulated protein
MDKLAYRLFDREGKSTDYEQMIKDLRQADIILFGELHNNPISHWLQIEVTKDVFATQKQNLILGAEMFEADNQLILDEYLAKLITEKHLKDEAKVWDNYDTDYKPLVDFALKNQLSFVATNVPRRYASLVSKKGLGELEKLSKEAKQWIAPLPITVDLTLNCYAEMMKMMTNGHNSGGMGGMNPENFANAQALKDATMAHFILKNWQKGKALLHFNGAYHSDRFESIVWYLKRQKPDLKIVTISSVEQKDIDKLEDKNKGLANYIITTPDNMTKTY